jgi:hypothetical protein
MRLWMSIYAYASKYQRTGIVFNVYPASSLKLKVPQNWRSFWRDNDNKTELFHFLTDRISEMDTLNILIVNKGEDAVSNQTVNLDAGVPMKKQTLRK